MPFLFFIIICLSSCASLKEAENRPFAYITDTSKFILLPPGDIEIPMDAHQQISISYGPHNFVFNAWVKADETGLEMSLFNEMGASAGELSYRDGAVTLKSSVIPGFIPPEFIVADFQLCFYDPVLLRQSLQKAGLDLETAGEDRRILKGKNVIIEVEKHEGLVKLVNHHRGYSYTLEGNF